MIIVLTICVNDSTYIYGTDTFKSRQLSSNSKKRQNRKNLQLWICSRSLTARAMRVTLIVGFGATDGIALAANQPEKHKGERRDCSICVLLRLPDKLTPKNDRDR